MRSFFAARSKRVPELHQGLADGFRAIVPFFFHSAGIIRGKARFSEGAKVSGVGNDIPWEPSPTPTTNPQRKRGRGNQGDPLHTRRIIRSLFASHKPPKLELCA